MRYWRSYESGLEGVYTLESIRALYEETVDKSEYPVFEGWLWDMERSATFHVHDKAVEFVQAYSLDYDEWGAECLRLEWEESVDGQSLMTYTYDGIQERPITPSVTHIYDINPPEPAFIGSIEVNYPSDSDDVYFEKLARLISDYLEGVQPCKA